MCVFVYIISGKRKKKCDTNSVCVCHAQAILQAVWVIVVLFEIAERCGFIDSVTRAAAQPSFPYLMENKQQLVWCESGESQVS